MSKRMIDIGKDKIIEMITEMGLSREETAERIRLSKGGLYHITHKSGKMTPEVWDLFRREYEKITGKKIQLRESNNKRIILKHLKLEELISEIVNRGWEITFKKSSDIKQ